MTDFPPRHVLDADLLALFSALPAMGRVMVFSTSSSVTHERIGMLTGVDSRDGWAHLTGPDHDSRVRLDAIKTITVNRSRRMGDKAYPRIELNGEAGEVACIVGFEGLEPFDRALASFGVGPAVELVETAFNTMPGDQAVAADDAGSMPLRMAREAARPATIEFYAPHFAQRWVGVVPELRISHGFINIIEPNFHLHIRGGTIAGWDGREEGRYEALDADGGRIGFAVTM